MKGRLEKGKQEEKKLASLFCGERRPQKAAATKPAAQLRGELADRVALACKVRSFVAQNAPQDDNVLRRPVSFE